MIDLVVHQKQKQHQRPFKAADKKRNIIWAAEHK
jgi:hypothetical protein